MWHWGYGGWWMGLTMILLWAGAAALIVWIVRTTSQRTDDDTESRRALDVLDERYARGEIDDDEYRRRRDMLEQAREPTTVPSAAAFVRAWKVSSRRRRPPRRTDVT